MPVLDAVWSGYLGVLDIIILGILQGFTEFLPVSSTGHLVVAQALLGFEDAEQLISLDIFLHLPTIIAVLIFFRLELKTVFRGLFGKVEGDDKKSALHLVKMIVISIITTIAVYFLFKSPIENVFENGKLVGAAFLFTAIILIFASLRSDEKLMQPEMKIWHAIFIGAAQGIAITPGVSRSGMTICAALIIGLKSEEAFRFSFLLSIPTIIIAWLYDIISDPGALSGLSETGPLVAGFVVAFVAGLVAIYLLKGAVLKRRLWYFSIYLIPVGIFTLLHKF